MQQVMTVTWLNPRFANNGNGTVMDNLTGLIWLKNANCFGGRSWVDALSDCNSLANGSCGLTDGSTAGDWRMPHVKELHSLLDFEFYSPILSNDARTEKWGTGTSSFTGVQSDYYWSSTTYAVNTSIAWVVFLSSGGVRNGTKTNLYYVWPVRGGQ